MIPVGETLAERNADIEAIFASIARTHPRRLYLEHKFSNRNVAIYNGGIPIGSFCWDALAPLGREDIIRDLIDNYEASRA
ncbi:MAG: hypothetical protein SFZ02_12365 [bacterium]|nr:hypothetical protein [bacterium]